MKCVRCEKEFDSTIPELNAEYYGSNVFACPFCGKPYKFYRTVTCRPLNSEDVEFCEIQYDDWGHKIN